MKTTKEILKKLDEMMSELKKDMPKNKETMTPKEQYSTVAYAALYGLKFFITGKFDKPEKE